MRMSSARVHLPVVDSPLKPPSGRRRKRAVRAETIRVTRMSKARLQMLRSLSAAVSYWRPNTRADCSQVARPCPYVSCRFNLYLDVLPSGNIKLNFPDLDPDELTVSCALDVAEAGGSKRETIADLMNLTRERLRQIEIRVLRKLADAADALRDFTTYKTGA
jgi:hypothetical protein